MAAVNQEALDAAREHLLNPEPSKVSTIDGPATSKDVKALAIVMLAFVDRLTEAVNTAKTRG